jgi:hypothetical protein
MEQPRTGGVESCRIVYTDAKLSTYGSDQMAVVQRRIALGSTGKGDKAAKRRLIVAAMKQVN